MHNIPNILSSLRIVMIPFIVKMFLAGNTIGAGVLLAISGVTDLLDGTLARSFNWGSQLGKVLDPIADKLTLISISITLAYLLREYRLFFIIILVKDFLMLAFGGYLLRKKVHLQGAKTIGKVATALFYVVMVGLALFPNIPEEIIRPLIALVVAVELLAALSYVPEFNSYRKTGKPHS